MSFAEFSQQERRQERRQERLCANPAVANFRVWVLAMRLGDCAALGIRGQATAPTGVVVRMFADCCL